MILLSGQITMAGKHPKLVVGIVVDQMRYDYLYNYWSKYSENGFKKLVDFGYNFTNSHYNYVPTYTAPGHASVYTGTTPSTHGIIANDWYDRKEGKIYCVEDAGEKSVGTSNASGQMSPKRLISSTIGDELKIASGGKSKVIGIALKDRSSILPAGHAADGAFWFDDESGNFISSTFYIQQLPQWIIDFNNQQLAKKYCTQKWELLLSPESYTESLPDDNPYEHTFPGENKPVFPHDLAAISKAMNGSYGIIKSTPFGNTITTDLALAAITNAELGKDEYTDLLAISYSSTDFIGHSFGPKAMETEDCYLRLDLELARLITALEKNIGKDNFILFLTADHAGSDNPAYMKSLKIPAGYIHPSELVDGLNNYLLEHFPSSDASNRFISSIVNNQIFFNLDLLHKAKIDRAAIENITAAYLRDINGIANVMTRTQLLNEEYRSGIKHIIQNGYNEKRSGDVVFNFEPGWMDYGEEGTTHGSPYTYDTHVPMVFFGAGIPKGSSAEFRTITDIAPTIALMLHISFPNGTTGEVIPQLIPKQ